MPDNDIDMYGLVRVFHVHGLYKRRHQTVAATDEADARRRFHAMHPGFDGTIFKVTDAPAEEAAEIIAAMRHAAAEQAQIRELAEQAAGPDIDWEG